MAYVRTVKTASGARAVQIVYSQRRGSRDIEHIGLRTPTRKGRLVEAGQARGARTVARGLDREQQVLNAVKYIRGLR